MTAVKRTTRQHRSGNSFSVRLPRDLAYANPDQELEIERRGDELVIRPGRMTLDELFAWIDARGGSRISDDALIRGDGRPNPWDKFD